MGFLLGAFGKLAAARRRNDLQARQMRIFSRLRRVSRDIANMDKSLQKQEQMELNALKAQGLLSKNIAMSQLPGASTLRDMTMGNGQVGNQEELSNSQNQYNQGAAWVNAQFESMMSYAQQQIADKYEYLRESQLEPLKQEEEMLNTEKETLATQLQVAEADYKFCVDMEKGEGKNLFPQYSGQG